ncbi:non-canonical purine NTP diphosphatase [Geofilum rubicundum]|uniref:dITP/XTP pyrophosphatase n=1 Tax=Geofilum rubicundum JCM 15548 TaxID=1236989 RepID=A0A0E9LSZ6_9BACT|nr:non-canonical purine NTP diphosphatase [Geofilum rubicundum]GAO28281.1 nucleoside 5-triphosphatase RdgB [Geofilum rubicundum JCM 15548]
MKLLFATHNQHKLEEIQQLITPSVELVSLNELRFSEEIDETGTDLTENALIKAQTIYRKFQLDTFADDTGLEVDVLNGEPGVYSARYAGEEKNSVANMQKVLSLMQGQANRKARFRTVIALIYKQQEFLFEGIVNGEILEVPMGQGGFGYDPIFKPEGFDQSFAQMNAATKNSISHRGRAVEQLINFIHQIS